MSRKNNILLTLSQIAIGGAITVAGILIYLLIFKNLWQVLIDNRITHGFWVGLFLLISIGCTYGVIVVGVSEGIRYVGRKFGIDIPFKPVCSGAFLGAPAIVGPLELLNLLSDISGIQNIIFVLIFPVFKALVFLLSLPVQAWLMLRLPIEILYVLSIPIGAILGYRLANIEEVEVNVQEA